MNPPLTVNIRPDVFKSDWVRYGPHGYPDYAVRGPKAAMVRQVVRTAYSARRLANTVDVDRMNGAEHWVASTTRWLRRLYYLRAHAGRFPNLRQKLVTKMVRCSPSGYRLVDPYNLPWKYCNLRFCLYCHARRVRTYFDHLVTAYSRRPPGAPVWVAVMSGSGVRNRPSNLINSIRAAAAVSFSIPPDNPDLKTPLHRMSTWGFRVVALSDNRTRLHHPSVPGRIWPVRSVTALAIACAKAFAYPKWWAYAPPGEFARLLVQNDADPYADLKLWALHGAARPDYAPGRSLLDYAGFDPDSPS